MSARLKLNYFTPLRPERTGIAEFSLDVLPALGELADVAVWTYQAEWTPIDAPGVTVRRYDRSAGPGQLAGADMTFFNMGNNFRFHGAIFEAARQFPGVVILHEPNLQYFFFDRARASAKYRRDYMAIVARHYGDKGVGAARRLFWRTLNVERMLVHYPMTEAALEGALAVVTHDRTVRRNVEQSTGLPTFFLPLAHRSRQGATAAKLAHDPPYKLITFGYMNENRRLDAIARAILSLPEHDRFVWDLYGMFRINLVPRLTRWRLGGAFRPHGYVQANALDAAVAAADLAINVRNPSMGEASSTQLKTWAHGLPSLVSRTGWYADQPADTLFFVEPGREFEEVASYLRAFLDNPEPFFQAGRRGREYVERVHNPAHYAAGLIDIAKEIAAHRARDLTPGRPATLR
ncbi:MAG TPA: hypothetical protein VH020_02805 [Stellaceae bacterium]|nr:hypothetical protein [Stellaceae bacterium]